MGLSLKLENGRRLPVITCDGCEEVIEDWTRALITGPDQETGFVPVKVFHKGACDRAQRRGNSQGWVDLDSYLPWLLWNAGWGEQGYDPDTVLISVPEEIL